MDDVADYQRPDGVRQRLRRWLRGFVGVTALDERLRQEQDDTRRVLKAARNLGERLRHLKRDADTRYSAIERHNKSIRLELRDINASIRAIRTQLGSRGIPAALRSVRLDTRALLRRFALNPAELPYPHRLTAQRCSLGSQREEDGISWAVFEHVGPETRRFIDIGCGIAGGTAGFYARECGWRGLMIDADSEHVAAVRDRFSSSQVTAVDACVTRENVNQLIDQAGFTGDIDLLSVDIDGMDYWVWDALSAASPRLVIIEYNALFGHERSVTIPYDPTFDRSHLSGVLRKRYYGASLAAFVQLSEKKGYRLITVEPMALNALFLRNDVGPDIPACSIAELPYSDVKTSRFPDIYMLIEEAGLPLVDVG